MQNPSVQTKGPFKNHCKILISTFDRAFTLIELLIVIAIIAVLSGALLPGLTNYMDKQGVLQAREQLKSDLRSIQNNALTGVNAGPTVNYWGARIGAESATYEFFTSEDLDPNCLAVTVEDSSESFADGVITRNSSLICVYFSFNNGDATFYRGGASVSCSVLATSGCVITVGRDDASSGCGGVGVNSAGLIRSLGGQICT